MYGKNICKEIFRMRLAVAIDPVIVRNKWGIYGGNVIGIWK
jgi:hypothetical protein